jgi:4-nitrophenyl phosphatase
MWILDLDGVVWLLDTPIPGSPEAIRRLRSQGESLRFVTNNSVLTVSAYLEKFASMGIEVASDELVTSSMAAASLLVPGEKVYVVGGPGLNEQVANVASIVSDQSVDDRNETIDAVVVGWDRGFDFDRLRRAMWAVGSGARLIATNTDPTYPTPRALIPGAGAIVAAVERATGVAAQVAGKPDEPMAAMVRRAIGDDRAVMVGDRYSTDGEFATRLGIPFYLVQSGVEEHIPSASPQPAQIAPDLATLVDESAATTLLRRIQGA